MTYLKDIIFAAVICGITTGMTQITGTKSSKYVRFICGMIFLSVLISPFAGKIIGEGDFTNDLKNISNGSSVQVTDENAIREMISREICKAAVKNASRYFNVSENSFNMSLVMDGNFSEEYRIREATIYITSNKYNLDRMRVKERFETILNCNVEVILNE